MLTRWIWPSQAAAGAVELVHRKTRSIFTWQCRLFTEHNIFLVDTTRFLSTLWTETKKRSWLLISHNALNPIGQIYALFVGEFYSWRIHEKNVFFSQWHRRLGRQNPIWLLPTVVEPMTFWLLVQMLHQWATGETWRAKDRGEYGHSFILGVEKRLTATHFSNFSTELMWLKKDGSHRSPEKKINQ